MIQHHLKYKYGGRSFWARGYYVDIVGKNEKIIKQYIRNQLEDDYMADQVSIREYIDPLQKNPLPDGAVPKQGGDGCL